MPRGPRADTADPAESGAAVAARVAEARVRAARRLAGVPWQVNADIPGTELFRRWPAERGAFAPVERALDCGQISARGAAKVLRVAWTIADLAGKPQPGRPECDEALSLWLGVA